MPASIPSITVLLPRDVKRWLTRRAEMEGTKVGPYVRKLIEADYRLYAAEHMRTGGIVDPKSHIQPERS